jgi:nucleotide sugar dehydrogenase
VVKPIIEEEFKNRGLTVDQYLLGHSYERVMPGPKYIESIQSFPRVYSGINCQSADAIEEFLKTIIDVARCQLTRLETTNATEIAKVLENSYRALNIAFMIEWTRFAEEAKVNLYEIVKAIRVRDTHRNLMLPGIGVGGYCLTKDPLLASWSRKNNFGGGSDLMMSVGAVSQNNQMPIHAFDRLRRDYGSLSGKVIGICGVSYRGDVGDTRFSPVQPFVEAIEVAGGQCYCHDPYVSDWCELNRKIYNKLSDILSFDIDIIVICAGHKVYSDPQFCAQINASKRPLFLFDTIGYLDQEQIESLSRFHRVKVLGRGDI